MTFSVLTNYTADVLHFNYADNYVGVGPRNRFSSAPASERLHIKDGALRVNGYETPPYYYSYYKSIKLGSNSDTMMMPYILSQSNQSGNGLAISVEAPSYYTLSSNHHALAIHGRQYSGAVPIWNSSNAQLSSGHILTICNEDSKYFQVVHNGQILLGGYPILYDAPRLIDISGAYLGAGGHWINNSRQATKRNIAPVEVDRAWDGLDLLTPVDYEYRRQERRWRLSDGREVASIDDLTETEREALAPVPFVVWTEEGSGEWHRGFIAEDLPEWLVHEGDDGPGVAAIDIAAHNTAVLQSARRRMGDMGQRLEGLETATARLVANAQTATSAQAQEAGQWEGAVAALCDRVGQTEAVEQALRARIVGEWIEIPFNEAWEEIEETEERETVKTLARYRYDLETLTVFAGEEEAVVMESIPTGRTTRRLRADVWFDTATGRCFQRP